MIYALMALIVFLYYHNHVYQISRYKISNDIPISFNGFKIVHLSDLHDHKLSQSFYRKLDFLNPDIVVITGDIIDSRNFNLMRCKKNIQSIHYPIYYVTGNHEMASRRMLEILAVLKSVGVIHLKNELVSLRRENDWIDIYGQSMKNYAKITKKRYTILLSHRSELRDYFKSTGADLILTGHAHGGQVRFFSKGLYAPNQGWWPQFTSGQHKLGKAIHIINRGIGNSTFKQRMFNRPEIVLIELERK